MDNERTDKRDNNSKDEMARDQRPNTTTRRPNDRKPEEDSANNAERDLVEEDRFEATDN